MVDKITWSIDATPSSARYAHFMEKEIFEQPAALENTMRGRFSEDGSTAQFGGLNISAGGIPPDRPLHVLRLRHRLARLPGGRAPDRALRPHAGRGGLRLRVPLPQHAARPATRCSSSISQSGETIDTLAALREAKRKGYQRPRDQQRRRLDHRPRSRRRHLSARRPGNRRRVDQGVHLAAADRRDARALHRPHARHELQRRRAST